MNTVTFAVQLVHETTDSLTRLIFQEATVRGFKFGNLELLDVLQVGSIKFGRYRICAHSWVPQLMDALYTTGRGVVSAGASGFEVRLVGGRKGSLPTTTMLASARNPKLYRGSADPNWKRQFEA